MDKRAIRIEPLEAAHVSSLFESLNHESVGQFIGGPDVTTPEALAQRVRRVQAGPPPKSGLTWLNYAIVMDGRAIGRVEATVHGDYAEIAYLLGPSYWGRGHATVAVAQLLEVLAGLGVRMLWATVHPDNLASRKLLGRLGFAPAAPGTHPALASLDDGDVVFNRRLDGPQSPAPADAFQFGEPQV